MLRVRAAHRAPRRVLDVPKPRAWTRSSQVSLVSHPVCRRRL